MKGIAASICIEYLYFKSGNMHNARVTRLMQIASLLTASNNGCYAPNACKVGTDFLWVVGPGRPAGKLLWNDKVIRKLSYSDCRFRTPLDISDEPKT